MCADPVQQDLPIYETCPEMEHSKTWNSLVDFVLKSLSNMLKHVIEIYPQCRAYADIYPEARQQCVMLPNRSRPVFFHTFQYKN